MAGSGSAAAAAAGGVIPGVVATPTTGTAGGAAGGAATGAGGGGGTRTAGGAAVASTAGGAGGAGELRRRMRTTSVLSAIHIPGPRRRRVEEPVFHFHQRATAKRLARTAVERPHVSRKPNSRQIGVFHLRRRVAARARRLARARRRVWWCA